ncbi:MAG: hypothetical protein J6X91_07855 [Bacteroidales bacterium]|nr:hypothetical protein [Bacteroidales bacterium]
MKRFPFLILTVALLLAATPLSAQNVSIEEPVSDNGVKFAIVIDGKTFSNVKDQVYSYRDALSKDGLDAYIISGDWENPDQVREEIRKVYLANQKNFEGIVLVGDIPVVMVRNAQNMTRRFKMNENQFEKGRSSVPSDRFYDDLGLEFEFISKSKRVSGADGRELFFYNLKPESRQYLAPDFYSGRIMYPAGIGGDKYKAIGDFLAKAAAAHLNPPKMRDMLLSRGALSEGEDPQARSGVVEMLRDQIPFLEEYPQRLFTLDFSKDYEPVTDNLLMSLKNKRFSIFYYRGHGNFGEMQPGAAGKGKWKIPEEDIRNLPVQMNYIILNSCFNGTIHRGKDIAGAFLFSKRNVLAVQAVSINSWQDEWMSRYMGIIYGGARVGEYHRLFPLLERNIIGDPTFHFASCYDYDLKDQTVLKAEDEPYWTACLERGLPPQAEGSRNNSLSCVAVNRLQAMGKLSSSEIVQRSLKTISPSVSLEYIMQVYEMFGRGYSPEVSEDLLNMFRFGLQSNAEFVVRHTAVIELFYSNPLLCQALIETMNTNIKLRRARCRQFTGEALGLMPPQIVDSVLATSPTRQNAKLCSEVKKAMEAGQKHKRTELMILTDTHTETARRVLHAIAVKNWPYPDQIQLYLQMIANSSLNTEIRLHLADGLGYFDYSYKKGEVIDGVRKLLEDPSVEATMRNSMNRKSSLRDMLKKTLGRLED